MFAKDIPLFWKPIQKYSNTRLPLVTTLGGVTGECNSAEMWQDHYKLILSSVKNNSQQ